MIMIITIMIMIIIIHSVLDSTDWTLSLFLHISLRGCRRKLEYPDKIHAHMGGAYKALVSTPGLCDQGLNQRSSCYQVDGRSSLTPLPLSGRLIDECVFPGSHIHSLTQPLWPRRLKSHFLDKT